jgi:hypothetical protein
MSPRLASVVFGLASLLVLADAVGAAQPSRTSAPKKATGGATQPAGRIYKWVDNQGVTHYGQAIPMEYREQGGAEMNKGGLTVRRIDPVATPEQRKAAEDKARREKEEQKRLFEQRRRDTALLNTYTSSREIDEARDRNLALPSQAIRGLEPRVKKSEDRLAALQARAGDLEKAGRPVPDHLLDDIEQQKLELEGLRADIGRHQSQIEAIRARFDHDKQRYIELTQLTPR